MENKNPSPQKVMNKPMTSKCSLPILYCADGSLTAVSYTQTRRLETFSGRFVLHGYFCHSSACNVYVPLWIRNGSLQSKNKRQCGSANICCFSISRLRLAPDVQEVTYTPSQKYQHYQHKLYQGELFLTQHFRSYYDCEVTQSEAQLSSHDWWALL